MKIRGKITNSDNLDLLNLTLEEEKKFNKPYIAIEWVANRYKENKEKYGQYLYEAETIKFIDTDVFRQAALRYLDTGEYCHLDEEFDNKQFNIWWDRETYRCVHGMTAWARIDEKGNYGLVHCPAKLYGFINYAIMLMLEDIDTDDPDSKEDLDYELVETVSREASVKMSELLKGLSNIKTGDKVIGLPKFFDGQYAIAVAKEFSKLLGLNWFYGKARRKGQSYWNAWCAFHNYNFISERATIQAAYDKAYLTKGKGLFKMVRLYCDHINKNTDWKKSKLKDTAEEIRSGYQYEGEDSEYGFKSEVIAVSAQHNEDVTIGKDCIEVQYEELGKFLNFKQSFGVTTSTAEAGDYKTGQITGWGTAGTKEANWEHFEDVCYNPGNYDSLPCNNLWDQGAEGTACCYFYPHVQSLEGHMDEYGNTNYKTAWASFIEKKEEKRKNTSDSQAFATWCGQRANSPEEAFARNSNNIFDSDAIQDQLNFITRNPKVLQAQREGIFIKVRNGIRLKTNEELLYDNKLVHGPVYDFPLKKDTDVHGCWVEWIPPYRDSSGKVPKDLYVACQDPYATDKDTKEITTQHSLGATYIFEVPNNITPFGGGIPVGAYVGRPPKLDYYNKQVSYGLQYWNAKMMFENNTGDTKSYMQRMHLLDYLIEEPSLEFDKDISGKTSRGYGLYLTDKKKAKAALYLRDLLDTTLGKDIKTNKRRTLLNYIYDPALLKELLKWSLKGNFDRCSSWLILMFIIKQYEYEERKPKKATAGNSFFNRKRH